MITILFTKRAQKDIKKIDISAKELIISSIQRYQKGIIKDIPLKGSWKGWYKIRVGPYRILLTKQTDSTHVVGYIRHRKDAYKIKN